MLELINRQRTGTQILGQPVLLHRPEDMWIGYRRPDPVRLGSGVAALQVNLGERFEHRPLGRSKLVPWPVGLPGLAPNGGDQNGFVLSQPTEQAHREPVRTEEPLQIIQSHHHPGRIQPLIHQVPQRLARLRDQQRGIREPLAHDLRC